MPTKQEGRDTGADTSDIMERLLSVSRELKEKVHQNETAAGELLRQCEELREELRSMRQWREVVPSAEESHVQMPNIEFKYIKQLQAENTELRVLLEEHQAAIEMIMTKYRQQVGQFMNTERQEKGLTSDTTAEELLHRTDQLYHMAAVVSMTMQEEDTSSQKTVEYITQLECENKHLRDLLHFTQSGLLDYTPDSSPHPTNTDHPTRSSQQHEETSRPHSFPTPPVPMATEGGTYTATPINSGQATPVATPTSGEENAQPLLQQAADKLTDEKRVM